MPTPSTATRARIHAIRTVFMSRSPPFVIGLVRGQSQGHHIRLLRASGRDGEGDRVGRDAGDTSVTEDVPVPEAHRSPRAAVDPEAALWGQSAARAWPRDPSPLSGSSRP